ncbi:hypothetical protein PA10_00146 [Pseudomonas phage pPa_SNUABM_DT01]|nr:hypothetical protein PA10_00146 [Pseudomonas phage pPa_SNUABM_DT01]
MNAEEQRKVITPLIQSAYNLTFNPALRGGTERQDGKQLEEGITLFPNGIDVTLNGATQAIRWELDDHKVINVTYVPLAYFNLAWEALSKYLKHTE